MCASSSSVHASSTSSSSLKFVQMSSGRHEANRVLLVDQVGHVFANHTPFTPTGRVPKAVGGPRPSCSPSILLALPTGGWTNFRWSDELSRQPIGNSTVFPGVNCLAFTSATLQKVGALRQRSRSQVHDDIKRRLLLRRARRFKAVWEWWRTLGRFGWRGQWRASQEQAVASRLKSKECRSHFTRK
jgi:hypothetical protein